MKRLNQQSVYCEEKLIQTSPGAIRRVEIPSLNVPRNQGELLTDSLGNNHHGKVVGAMEFAPTSQQASLKLESRISVYLLLLSPKPRSKRSRLAGAHSPPSFRELAGVRFDAE